MATAPEPTIDLSEVAETYRKIRDAKAERRKAWEAEEAKYDEQLGQLEGFMLAHLNSHNVNSMNTAGGTVYRQIEVKPSIVDDNTFYDWVHEHKASDALQRRVAVGFVKEYMESHKDANGNDGPPPPGIAVHREWVVRVRKPS